MVASSIAASNAIRVLAAQLRASPPPGTTQEDIDLFFTRHSLELVELLVEQLESALTQTDETSGSPDSGIEYSDIPNALQPPPSRTHRSGAVETDLLRYSVVIRGVWGRNRKSDTTVQTIVDGVDPRFPMSVLELLPIMRKRVADMKVKPGAQLTIQEQPITVTKYPDSNHATVSFVLTDYKTLFREALA